MKYMLQGGVWSLRGMKVQSCFICLVAVKELKVSYYHKGSILFTICP